MQGRAAYRFAGIIAVAMAAACQTGAEPAGAPSKHEEARVVDVVPVPLQVFAQRLARAPADADRLAAAVAIESLAPPPQALRLIGPAFADASVPNRLAAIRYVARLAAQTELQPTVRAVAGGALVDALAASPAERDAAYAVLVRLSGQDFSPANLEAWRTWLAPATAATGE